MVWIAAEAASVAVGDVQLGHAVGVRQRLVDARAERQTALGVLEEEALEAAAQEKPLPKAVLRADVEALVVRRRVQRVHGHRQLVEGRVDAAAPRRRA